MQLKFEQLWCLTGRSIITVGGFILIHNFNDYKNINYWWINKLYLSEYDCLHMSTLRFISYPTTLMSADVESYVETVLLKNNI